MKRILLIGAAGVFNFSRSLLVCILIIATLPLLGACTNLPPKEPSKSEVTPSMVTKKIRQEFSDRSFDEKGAETFALEYGRDAVPILIDLLKSDDAQVPKGKVAIYLGKLGDPSAVKPMQEFIANALQYEIPKYTYLDLVFALHSLGFIGNEASLGYLRKGTHPEFWNIVSPTVAIPELKLDHPGTVQAMREASLRAYASSGKKTVIDDLLKHSDDFKGFSDRLYKDALEEAHRRYSGKKTQKRKMESALK